MLWVQTALLRTEFCPDRFQTGSCATALGKASSYVSKSRQGQRPLRPATSQLHRATGNGGGGGASRLHSTDWQEGTKRHRLASQIFVTVCVVPSSISQPSTNYCNLM